MNSEDIKTAALCWLRWGRQYPFVATEVGRWSADVLGATKTTMTEVEVKISKSDLKADFVKPKHKFYAEISPLYRGAGWLPNQMYFAVPEELQEFALTALQEKNPKYGLLVFKEGLPNGHNLTCMRTAKKLHQASPSPKVLEQFVLRMGSEICNFHAYSHRYRSWLEEMKHEAKHMSGASDADPEPHAIMEEGEKKDAPETG